MSRRFHIPSQFVTGVLGEPWQERWISGEYGATAVKGITAGDVIFHYLLPALYECGSSDVIDAMTNESDDPSYVYQSKKARAGLGRYQFKIRLPSK